MQSELLELIESEIEGLRRRYATLAREWSGVREVPARWVADATGLRWFVPLENVVECDIDVEIAREVLIVRAQRNWPDPALLLGILPVPSGFDPEHPHVRFVRETLQVRVRRRGRGGSR